MSTNYLLFKSVPSGNGDTRDILYAMLRVLETGAIASSIIDGGDVTFGAEADGEAASDTGAYTYMSFFKRFLNTHLTTVIEPSLAAIQASLLAIQQQGAGLKYSQYNYLFNFAGSTPLQNISGYPCKYWTIQGVVATGAPTYTMILEASLNGGVWFTIATINDGASKSSVGPLLYSFYRVTCTALATGTVTAYVLAEQ
jgi:hypothetical protein